MVVAKGWAPTVGIGVMVMVLLVAIGTGYWSTQGRFVTGGGRGPGGGEGLGLGEGSTTPSATDAGAGLQAQDRGDIEPNSLDPAALRGWMTIAQACLGLSLEVPEFLAAAGLPADTSPDTRLRLLESAGLPIADIRTIVETLLDSPR